MSLVGGGGLMSQSHLHGGSCASLPYCQNTAATLSGPVVADVDATIVRPEKEMSNLSVVEKKCAVNGVVTRADNLLPSPTVVIQSPDSIQMQWDRRYMYIPEPVGLLNAGNTCFLNSVLQCLTFTAPLANYFLNNGHKRDNNCGDFCIICRMQSHVKTCFTINARFYKPNGILERLQMIARHMERGRQEDAHEFLRCLTEAMQKRLLINHKNLDAFSQETTLLSQIFGGYLRSQVVCCNCGGVSNTYEPFLDISLDVKDVNSVDEALKNFIRVETLDNDNMYGCDSCHRKVKAYKRFTVHQAPRVLTFQLKRYSANSSIKLNNRTNFPISLDIYRYLSDTLDGVPTHIYYELYGVLVHCGLTTTSGHYYCCAKSSNKNWYKLNDGVVTQIQVSDVLREEAYLLFYMQSGIKKTTPITPLKAASNVSSVSNKSSTDNIAISPLGSHVAFSSAAEVKLAQNGTGATALIGPQLPHCRICSTADNGNKTAETYIKSLHLPCASNATSKLVVHNANGSSVAPIRPTNLLLKSDNRVSGTSALQPTGHTFTAVNNRSSTLAQSDRVIPLKSGDERCKIVFNIKPNGLIKIKLPEPARVTPLNKLVPYDEGASDDSEVESDRPEVKCISAEDSAVRNSDCSKAASDLTDALLSITMIPDEPILPVKPLSDNQCGRLIPETMSLDDSIDLPVHISSNGTSSSVCFSATSVEEDHQSFDRMQQDSNGCECVPRSIDKVFGFDKIIQNNTVSSNAELANETSQVDAGTKSCMDQPVEKTTDHHSMKRKHHRHKKSKSEKRRRRTSVSVSDSSDEAEYVWVEKSIVQETTSSFSWPVGHSGTTQSIVCNSSGDALFGTKVEGSCFKQQEAHSIQSVPDHGDCFHVGRSSDHKDSSSRGHCKVTSRTRDHSSDDSVTSFSSRRRRARSRENQRYCDDQKSSYHSDSTFQSQGRHHHSDRDELSNRREHKSPRRYRSSHHESNRVRKSQSADRRDWTPRTKTNSCNKLSRGMHSSQDLRYDGYHRQKKY